MDTISKAIAAVKLAPLRKIDDAVLIAGDGKIDAVIDWKSDVDPDPALVELYRCQVRDYLAATEAPMGLIVFLTSGRIEEVSPNP